MRRRGLFFVEGSMSKQGFHPILRVKGYGEFTSPERKDGFPVELFHRPGDKSTVYSWVTFPDTAAGWRDSDMVQVHPGALSTVLVTVMNWAPILATKSAAEIRSFSITLLDRVPTREELRFEGRAAPQGAGKAIIVEGSVYDARDKLLARGIGVVDLHTPAELRQSARCAPQDIHAFEQMVAKL
jgi:hypothetical protein